jgi:hypothetical protein
METYRDSATICDKLLLESKLERIMWVFYRGKEQQRGYELLSKIVLSSLDFFLGRYPEVVRDMLLHLEDMDFPEMDAFGERVREVLALRQEELIL